MKNLLKFAFASLFAAVLLAGCAQDNNPVAPADGGSGNGNEGGGDPVIKTPPSNLKYYKPQTTNNILHSPSKCASDALQMRSRCAPDALCYLLNQ